MVVYEGHGIVRSELDNGAVKYPPQVVVRASFACLMEVVMQRDIEEGDLIGTILDQSPLRKGSRACSRGNSQVLGTPEYTA